MAKPETSRPVHRPDEVRGDEAVQPNQRVRLEPAGRRRQLRIERVARHGGAIEERSCRRGQRCHLPLHGGGHSRREPPVSDGGRARQFAQIERVAAGLLKDAPPDDGVANVSHQRGGRVFAEGRKLQHRRVGDPPQRVEQQRSRPHRSHRHGQEMRRTRGAPQQVQQELDRRGIGPVHVVEHQRDRLRVRELLQKPTHRLVAPKPLFGDGGRRRCVRVRRHRREDGCQLGAHLCQASGVQRRQMMIQRVQYDAERQVELVLGRPPLQHEHPPRLGDAAKRLQQGALADPRLTQERDDRGATVGGGIRGLLQRSQLALAAEHRGSLGAGWGIGGGFSRWSPAASCETLSPWLIQDRQSKIP